MDDVSSARPIKRFSSRRERLDHSFLNQRLQGAQSYDRIAGYFCGSILEVAGEALDTVQGKVRIVCNSELSPEDVATARAAANALRMEWCSSQPESLIVDGGDAARHRFSKLYKLLRSGKLEVKVLPDCHFGLIHGKAGVITLADGSKTSFLGSINESRRAWTANYELLWEDSSPDAVVWVQDEFDALWRHPAAVPLAEFILGDIDRLSRRNELLSTDAWKEAATSATDTPDPAAVFVESPVYRKQVGLWEHQKYFVKLAFDAHQFMPGGARFVLADQVGLGKTIQLAMAAELMALSGEKPVLVLAPKTLLGQWQDELQELLDMPSALWNGKQWVDENDIEYPMYGPEGILRCPRRVGLVSTGLVTARSEAANILKSLTYECVIVDEAHRARRKNLGDGRDSEAADPNNLLRFLYEISPRTKSMLLATATPVQLRPIEAWDLLDVLGRGSEAVLGGTWSKWRNEPETAIELITGQREFPQDDLDMWEWMRTPLPPRSEHRDFEIIRRSLGKSDKDISAKGVDWDRLGQPDRQRLRSMFRRFIEQYNPFIRHIVRRSRSYLETTQDPETKEPYLKPIRVELFGEGEDEAIRLPPFLRDAYQFAEQFCETLGKRMQSAGFLRTLLLRRVGSTVIAGRLTAEQMLGSWQHIEIAEVDEEEEEDEADGEQVTSLSRTLTTEERGLLKRFVDALTANQEIDPKYERVLEFLRSRRWLDRGCIIFSQYFDSVRWLAEQLVGDLPNETIAVYAGSGKSGVWEKGIFRTVSRDEIKRRVRHGELRLLIGTDAASEGLNLQRLGTLINLDLPWNPTRLEQRKGRIQRIGQLNDTVLVYNMRYLGSVEDRVHQLLSDRLQEIYSLFGQIPDVLEDVWISVAIGKIERAKERIAAVPSRHPFDIRYEKISKIDWESCERVLSAIAKRKSLSNGW